MNERQVELLHLKPITDLIEAVGLYLNSLDSNPGFRLMAYRNLVNAYNEIAEAATE